MKVTLHGEELDFHDDEAIRSANGYLYSEREINTPRNGRRSIMVTRLTVNGDDGQPKRRLAGPTAGLLAGAGLLGVSARQP